MLKIIGITILVLALIIGGTVLGFRNEAMSFNKTIAAQVQDMQAKYNEYFLKVREAAQVPANQMEALKDIYDKLISGRSADGAMMKWISESNVQIDQSTYVEIQRIISSGRAEIYNIQKVHIDTVREYNTYITLFPNNMVNGMFGYIEATPTVPIAGQVTDIFVTKVDKEIQVF